MADDVEKAVEEQVIVDVAEGGFKLGFRHIAAATVISVAAICAPILKAHEGNSLNSYQDIGGVWTACEGVAHVLPHHTYTPSECGKMNGKALTEKIYGVSDQIDVNLPDKTLAAHVDFAYNVGLGAYHTSRALRETNKGIFLDGCYAMLDFYRAGGHDCRLDKGKKHGCYGVYQYHIDDMNLCLEGLKENVSTQR